MLRARYFPRSDFLSAHVGYRPSYTWRSILRGREVLRKGLVWSIGNGASVDVWGDIGWIPRPGCTRPLSFPSPSSVVCRVSDLVDWANSTWDEEIVRRVLPIDAPDIFAIRLYDSNIRDELCWAYTKIK